jgi:tetratricopeptide (TPR) repeat protein
MHAAGQAVDATADRARAALRDAGDRAATLHALSAAERFYADALALTSDDHPERPELLFRLGRMRWHRLEEGGDELEAARDAFAAAGETDRTAETELLLAQIAWRRGELDRVRDHMAQARELVEGKPPSRIQAAVLTEASRYAMLANHDEEAIELGLQALELAESLGLDELRVQALNNVGTARGNAGDAHGLVEVEEAIALATRINYVAEVLRGLNNTAAQLVIFSRMEEAQEKVRQVRVLGERYGYLGFLRFLDGGPDVANPYHRGQWDESVAHADRFIAEVEAGSPHYQAPIAYSFRGLIRLARDDEQGAFADAESAYELGIRAGTDPQQLLGTLAETGLIYACAGDHRGATRALDGALAGMRPLRHIGWGVVVSTELAWTARAVGRADELRPILDGETIDSRWLTAARAILSDELGVAANLLGEIGARPMEALCRLGLAEHLVADGRRAEADEQLHAALAFYRSVGATRFLREGEALLAASA